MKRAEQTLQRWQQAMKRREQGNPGRIKTLDICVYVDISPPLSTFPTPRSPLFASQAPENPRIYSSKPKRPAMLRNRKPDALSLAEIAFLTLSVQKRELQYAPCGFCIHSRS